MLGKTQRTPPPARRARVPDEVADMKEMDINEDECPTKPPKEPKPTTAIRRVRNRGKEKKTNPPHAEGRKIGIAVDGSNDITFGKENLGKSSRNVEEGLRGMEDVLWDDGRAALQESGLEDQIENEMLERGGSGEGMELDMPKAPQPTLQAIRDGLDEGDDKGMENGEDGDSSDFGNCPTEKGVMEPKDPFALPENHGDGFQSRLAAVSGQEALNFGQDLPLQMWEGNEVEDAAAAGNALETRESHGYAVESNETFPKPEKDQRGGHEVTTFPTDGNWRENENCPTDKGAIRPKEAFDLPERHGDGLRSRFSSRQRRRSPQFRARFHFENLARK